MFRISTVIIRLILGHLNRYINFEH